MGKVSVNCWIVCACSNNLGRVDGGHFAGFHGGRLYLIPCIADFHITCEKCGRTNLIRARQFSEATADTGSRPLAAAAVRHASR